MLHILHTVGHHESNYQDAIWLFQSTFNRNSGHSSLSTVQHNSSNFLNQDLDHYAALAVGAESPLHHIRGFFFSTPFTNSHKVSQETKKEPSKLFLSLPLMEGQTGCHCFLGQAWTSPHTWGSLSFFWWGCEREAHCLGGMPKCRKGRTCRQPVRQMETSCGQEM